MSITVKCYATLAKFQPENNTDYPHTPGQTIRDLVEVLGIPVDEVAIIFINGRHTDLDREIADNDKVGLFPAVGGG